jgi:hypothetical protein
MSERGGVDWGWPIAQLAVTVTKRLCLSAFGAHMAVSVDEGEHLPHSRDGVRCKDLWLSALPAAPLETTKLQSAAPPASPHSHAASQFGGTAAAPPPA